MNFVDNLIFTNDSGPETLMIIRKPSLGRLCFVSLKVGGVIAHARTARIAILPGSVSRSRVVKDGQQESLHEIGR